MGAAGGEQSEPPPPPPYVDSKILDVTKIAQLFNEQASTGTFVHAKPLLEAPKAQKASPIVRTSENKRTLKSIRDGGDKQLAD